MNLRRIFPAFKFLTALALMLASAPTQAAPIRVTTWDFHPGAATTNGAANGSQPALVQEAAETLKRLQPDVIILQEVADWQTCQRLVQALQPEGYQMDVCSSFRDARGKLLRGQAAILSKVKPYLAWSEPWRATNGVPAPAGGVAFAAMRLADKNVGIFSVQMTDPDSSAREASARQLVQQASSLNDWKTNRLEEFILAGALAASPGSSRLAHDNALSYLEDAGFESVITGLPLQRGAALDFMRLKYASLTEAPLMTQTHLFNSYAVTYELDATTKTTVRRVALANTPESASASKSSNFWRIAGLMIGCVVVLIAAVMFKRSAKRRVTAGILQILKDKSSLSVAPPSNPPYVRIEIDGSTQTQSQTWRHDMPSDQRASVAANLARWLKQKFVQRLLSDRAQLLATQRIAALKALAVDERLTKIERHIQRRNQEYEQRIDDLEKDLVAAKAENRELIRSKIALIKAEMEKARATGVRSEQHQQY